MTKIISMEEPDDWNTFNQLSFDLSINALFAAVCDIPFHLHAKYSLNGMVSD